MTKFEQMVKELPPELHQEAEDFLEALLNKHARKQKPLREYISLEGWAGALADMRDQYTSVELQHKTLDWWGD